LLKWITAEIPIDNPNDDLFELRRVANRIIRAISQNDAKTFGIVGEYGCGKTSLLNLVEKGLDPKSFIICRVEGWGLNERGAAEFILDTALSKLSLVADSIAAQGLPAQYQRALKAAPSQWTGFLGALFGQNLEPNSILDRIDAIAECIANRLVLFIEDVDRNKHDKVVLSQIGALLDRLRGLRNISFVVAIGPDRSLDLAKLCDHIESLPTLESGRVEPIVKAFKRKCRETFVEDSKIGEEGLFSNVAPTGVVFLADLDPDPIQNNLATLLKTPRSLKLALRSVWSGWQNLHGEIYFDDLLIASSLRAAAPEVFDLLVRAADEIRGMVKRYSVLAAAGGEKAAAARNDELRKRLHEECRSLAPSGGRDLTAVMGLVAVLFPQWDHNIDPNPGNQRVRNMRPTDYWRRLLAEAVDERPADQEFLHALRQWQQNQSNLLSEMIHAEARWNDKMEQFSGSFTDSEIYDLAQAIFQKSLDQSGACANKGTSKAFLPLWRMAASRRLRAAIRFARREIDRSFRRSLRLALEIEYYWGSDRLLSAQESTRLRKFVERRCRKCLDGELLSSVLDPSFPWTLHHLMRHEHLRVTSPVSDWTKFIPILFDASERNPNALVPQLAFLVSVDRGEGIEHRGERKIDDGFVTAVFNAPQERLRLYTILSSVIDTKFLSKDAVAVVDHIRQQALERIESFGAPGSATPSKADHAL